MNRDCPTPDGQEISAGIARLEGYVLYQAEAGRARAEAEAFADRMPWLTTAQREEVVRLGTEDRLAMTHRYLRRVRDRCEELKGEYSSRYEELRLRLMLWTTAFLLTVGAAFGCALTVVRGGRL
ncbi:hypothetical protein CP973_17355 [Streptomyces albofaciens JCM 4342]|uniref:hypothetical protein n=1 Tax=Streptomyces albofaciens TaxID=66866 RepID=UPI00123C2B1B|nr:hypothetical protein [Streptomyces albofaciens]KAA6223457.1 hypothetical protein CP973_17355 [Streptomyces albofaciens JCM 4342]